MMMKNDYNQGSKITQSGKKNRSPHKRAYTDKGIETELKTISSMIFMLVRNL